MAQPPNQPPQQGGFGAPQNQPPQPPQVQPPQDQPPQAPPAPPAGGFGAPRMPAQPSQAPQAPPTPQPGYGYPQQSGPYAQPGGGGPYATPGPYNTPGPYGQPQQPGYGYPPQPQFPGAPGAPGTPPPAGGSRNPFKGKPAVAVGAAVAALLVIGGTVFAVTSGGDDKDKKPVAEQSDDGNATSSGSPVNPGDGSGDGGEDTQDFNAGRKAGEAKVLWYKEAPDAPASGAEAPGMWITGTTAVKAAYKDLVGYTISDGRPAWDTIAFPQKICAVTQQKTADDRIVVAYMSGTSDRAKCNQLQQIDLNTGAKGWKGVVADGELFDSALSIELSLTGNTLMVGRSQSGTAYDVRTGKKLYDKKKYGDACFPTAFAGGARLISVASCDATAADEHDEMQELDPVTGKVKWTQKFDKGWRVERMFSVDQLVVYSTNDDKNAWNISAFKPNGTFRSQVAFDEDFAPECGGGFLRGDLTGCVGAVADATTLYLPTEATSGPGEVVAIDLATGKEKWRVKSPVDEAMLPIGLEGGKLVAYVEPSYGAAGQVVSIPTTGTAHTPAKLMQLPESTTAIENGFYDRDLAWVDGRFYISSTRLSGDDDSKEKLMLAYGK